MIQNIEKYTVTVITLRISGLDFKGKNCNNYMFSYIFFVIGISKTYLCRNFWDEGYKNIWNGIRNQNITSITILISN